MLENRNRFRLRQRDMFNQRRKNRCKFRQRNREGGSWEVRGKVT